MFKKIISYLLICSIFFTDVAFCGRPRAKSISDPEELRRSLPLREDSNRKRSKSISDFRPLPKKISSVNNPDSSFNKTPSREALTKPAVKEPNDYSNSISTNTTISSSSTSSSPRGNDTSDSSIGSTNSSPTKTTDNFSLLNKDVPYIQSILLLKEEIHPQDTTDLDKKELVSESVVDKEKESLNKPPLPEASSLVSTAQNLDSSLEKEPKLNTSNKTLNEELQQKMEGEKTILPFSDSAIESLEKLEEKIKSPPVSILEKKPIIEEKSSAEHIITESDSLESLSVSPSTSNSSQEKERTSTSRRNSTDSSGDVEVLVRIETTQELTEASNGVASGLMSQKETAQREESSLSSTNNDSNKITNTDSVLVQVSSEKKSEGKEEKHANTLSDVTVQPSDILITNSAVHLLELTSQKISSLAQTPNGRPNIIGWHGNGSEILVEDALKTTQALYKVPINGQTPTLLSLGSIRNFEGALLNFSRTYISLIGQNLESAPEVYLSPVNNFNPVRLTNIHKDFPIFSNIQSEVITWKSFDGKEIEGILIYPKGYKKGNKIPLLAYIHGGPTSNWTENYVGFQSGGLPSFANISQAGFGLLAPNIRGSNGYGAPFRKSIYKNWGPDPFKDVMTGIDSLIEKGIVDPEKLAIAGASYGGYMAAWAITQTNRFKASIVNAGQVNLISYACLGETASLSEAFFGGPFWKDYDAWLENSPIMHVEKIKTPTLIQHGQKDSVVIPDQATELFHALKLRNIPVQLSLYFNQGHGLFGKSALVGSEETLAWLDHHVNPFQKK